MIDVAGEVIRVHGRSPTAEHIRQQRDEQLHSLMILRGYVAETHAKMGFEKLDQLRRFSLARGLPVRD
jgi:hypothetical protein